MQNMPIIRCILVLLAGAACSASSSTAPLPPQSPCYFPMKVGTKWVYQYGDKETVQVLTAIEAIDGAIIVTVTEQRPEPDLPRYEKIAVSDKGLFVFETCEGVIKVAHKDCLLKLPHKAGQTWKEAPASPTEPGKYTSYGPELVEVPAGKYQAIRVVLEYDGTPPDRVTTWYAPNVGMVKWAIGDRARVLKSFTPPVK